MSSYDIDCTINTEPMAKQLRSVTKEVSNTINAVISMQAAVMAAEAKAADQVCNDVNRGFHTLIRSQITQKIATLESDVNSHLMKLNQLSKQLVYIRNRMGRDYNMICSRYLKLFTAMNKELEVRISELDKPVMRFALTDTKALTNRAYQLTATVPISQIESLSTSQRILISNLKYRCMQLLGTMEDFLVNMNKQRLLTDKLALPEHTDKDQNIAIPVVITEMYYGENEGDVTELHTGHGNMPQQAYDGIKNTLRKGMNDLDWKSSQVNSDVHSEFIKLVSSSNKSERVKDMISFLYNRNKDNLSEL